MKKLKFTLVAIVLILASCDKYGDYPVIKDKDSISFKLVDVSKGFLEVPLTPTLRWEKAFDCGFCRVTYEIYLGTEKRPQTLLASGVTENKFKIQSPLSANVKYHWWVLAREN